ncbi:MAG: nucleotidyltransferase family protein [Acidobacteria bacterium]|nr:nucleotidyltransferase family protein [Acidobacteriota bacterium]MBI3428122.1 nucleotidyltransferase family protein [Acidobacteriota bacterium]
MTFTLAEQILLSALLPTEASHGRLRQLMQTGVNGQAVDWLALVARAEAVYLAPLLRFNLARGGCLPHLPAAAQHQLEQSSQTWAARHMAYVHEAERLCTALAAAGIVAFPLKGAALMLGAYYPQAGLRPAVDLDLLVDPARITEAEAVAAACGYALEPGRTKARPRQRLPNELNHAAPRRGANGLLLELHTRAFHAVRVGRDFGFAEMCELGRIRSGSDQVSFNAGIDSPATNPVATAPGTASTPCAPAALALHLVHHTLVDLQSTHAILRTLADLHFILTRDGAIAKQLRAWAAEYGFRGAVEAALQAERLLAVSDLRGLKYVGERTDDCTLLLKTALDERPQGLAAAARLLEYLDFSHAPLRKLGNLGALLLTNREHLAQQYEGQGTLLWRYVQRPFVLLGKFPWSSLRPANLWRVWRWRKLTEASRTEA